MALIGELGIIESATAEKLQAFYQRWYQPQNAAVIVTGAVDEQRVNQLINKYFSPWKNSSPVKQNKYNINIATQPRYLALADKKVDANYLQFDYFTPRSRPTTPEAVLQRLPWRAALSILGQRINERVQETAGKVSGISTNWDYPSADVLRVSLSASMAGNGVEAATRLLQEEVAYLLQHGVTERELTAWKLKDIGRNLAYKETALKQGAQAIRHALYDKPMFERAQWLELLEQRFPRLTTATVNDAIRKLLARPAHAVVIHHPDIRVAGPQQIARWVTESKNKGAARPLAVAKTDDIDEWFISPQSVGRITAERRTGAIKQWTLSNGITVDYRYSNHQPGQVWFHLIGDGGTNRLAAQETVQARLALETLGASGLRAMSGPQLGKWLSDHNMALQPYFGFFDRGVVGQSGNANFARMMRLLHVALTESKVAPQAWQHNQAKNRQQLSQLLKSRTKPWRVQTERILFNNDPAFRLLTMAELNAVQPQQLQRLYERHFSGAQNYRLVLVGDLSEAAARYGVLESIATLPVVNTPTAAPRAYPRIRGAETIAVRGSGERAAVLIHKMTLAKQQVQGLDFYRLAYLSTWLNTVLLEELREKDGLVYSVSATLDGIFNGMEDYGLTLQLACNPAKVGQVKQRIAEILQQMSANPPAQQRLLAWQKTRASQIADGLQKPIELASSIALAEQTNIPLDRLEDVAYRTRLPQAEQLAAVLAQFNGSGARKTWLSWLP